MLSLIMVRRKKIGVVADNGSEKEKRLSLFMLGFATVLDGGGELSSMRRERKNE